MGLEMKTMGIKARPDEFELVERLVMRLSFMVRNKSQVSRLAWEYLDLCTSTPERLAAFLESLQGLPRATSLPSREKR